jgi:hypothetical protein
MNGNLYIGPHANQAWRVNFLKVAGYTPLHFLQRSARLRCKHKPHTLQSHEPRLRQRTSERGPIKPIETHGPFLKRVGRRLGGKDLRCLLSEEKLVEYERCSVSEMEELKTGARGLEGRGSKNGVF